MALPRIQFEEPKSNEGQTNRCNCVGALLGVLIRKITIAKKILAHTCKNLCYRRIQIVGLKSLSFLSEKCCKWMVSMKGKLKAFDGAVHQKDDVTRCEVTRCDVR